eukprot:SAG31_NODE_2547_length_5528_cov_4.438202_4_plen_204_part_00
MYCSPGETEFCEPENAYANSDPNLPASDLFYVPTDALFLYSPDVDGSQSSWTVIGGADSWSGYTLLTFAGVLQDGYSLRHVAQPSWPPFLKPQMKPTALPPSSSGDDGGTVDRDGANPPCGWCDGPNGDGARCNGRDGAAFVEADAVKCVPCQPCAQTKWPLSRNRAQTWEVGTSDADSTLLYIFSGRLQVRIWLIFHLVIQV